MEKMITRDGYAYKVTTNGNLYEGENKVQYFNVLRVARINSTGKQIKCETKNLLMTFCHRTGMVRKNEIGLGFAGEILVAFGLDSYGELDD